MTADEDKFPFTTPAGSDAQMFIQWKGTDVCLDFHCPCRPDTDAFSAHFDGDFAYFVECPYCGAVYEMGTQVIARKLAAGEQPPMEPKRMSPSLVDLDEMLGRNPDRD
jgi:hypothetical protein